MRAVALLLFFAAAFGLAGLWQSRRLGRLERERDVAYRVQAGKLGETPSGLLEAGMGVVVIGRRSGAEPIAGATNSDAAPVTDDTQPVAVQDEQPKTPPAEPPARLSDFELAVQPGQTLSSIVREHYGSATPALIHALATYNGLGNENALEIGQRLRLPSAETLQR